MKLKKHDKMPNFEFMDLDGNKKEYYDILDGDKNVLVMLRYYGCTVCKLSMIEFQENLEKIKANGVNLAVALQSDPALLKEEIGPNAFDYHLVLDPEQTIYKLLDLDVAADEKELVGEGNLLERAREARNRGLEHGRYEGEELQFPASFLVNEKGEVLDARYGKDVVDTYTVEDILSF